MGANRGLSDGRGGTDAVALWAGTGLWAWLLGYPFWGPLLAAAAQQDPALAAYAFALGGGGAARVLDGRPAVVLDHGFDDGLDDGRDGGAGEEHKRPDEHQLEPHQPVLDLKEGAEHDQPQAEVVGLGQRMKPREHIGQAQQADGAG